MKQTLFIALNVRSIKLKLFKTKIIELYDRQIKYVHRENKCILYMYFVYVYCINVQHVLVTTDYDLYSI